MRAIAVDWSGAAADTGKIWLAEAAAGQLLRFERMPGRDAVAARLIDEAARDRVFVAGLDFAFSMPVWFAGRCGARTAPELWRVVEEQGERWLAECAPPFWGRTGSRKPVGVELFRRCESPEAAAVAGVRPKSVFQVGGAGAVGTGSVRGMPVLRRLRDAGFSVWPFDTPTWPVAVEIYPRWFTGPVRKSDAASRAAHLRRYDALMPEQRAAAASSEDAFDAAVSAIEMSRHAGDLASFSPARDSVERIEGAIWLPAEREQGTGDRGQTSAGEERR